MCTRTLNHTESIDVWGGVILLVVNITLPHQIHRGGSAVEKTGADQVCCSRKTNDKRQDNLKIIFAFMSLIFSTSNTALSFEKLCSNADTCLWVERSFRCYDTSITKFTARLHGCDATVRINSCICHVS